MLTFFNHLCLEYVYKHLINGGGMMGKRRLWILVIIISVLTLLRPIDAKANDKHVSDFERINEANTIGNSEYAITRYRIDMQVKEDNIYEIREDIEVYFNVPKHGIIRSIPTHNNIERLDGSRSKNKAKITNIKSNHSFTTTNSSGYKDIKIGDPNYTLTGYINYIIIYTYDIGNDPSQAYDELYFNLIGHKWDTTISNVEFTITMPKEFDSSKLGFSSGPLGYTDNHLVSYNVEDSKIIKGKYEGVLERWEGLTIRLELPEGYFLTRSVFTPRIKFMLFTPISFVLIIFVLWYKFCRDKKVEKRAETYPPKEFNSLELGLWYKGKVEDKDVISLLIYLANKGYINIEEFTDGRFNIIKTRDYYGNNYYEERFLSGLFRGGRREVNSSELNNDFSPY